MIRKLVVVLLTGVICLIGVNSLLADQNVIYSTIEEYEEAVGKKIEKFSEAPMLKEKVATGELPPLEERLPQEPLVVQPADKIGKYGGDFRTVHAGGIWDIENILREFPFTYSSDLGEIKPNIFKSWEVSEEGRIFTFYMRKGMKWSDGYPFTADDFMFWYEDIALNEELNPAGLSRLKIGGEMGVMEKIDDYTIRISFLEPYGVFVRELARWRPVPYVPKHYLEQFHPRYTTRDELNKIVKEEGFDSWVSLFATKREYTTNPEIPTIWAWKILNRFSEPVQRLVRNPYYWKIDTAGNQLPYVDKLHQTFVGDPEGILLKCLAGDVDYLNGARLGYDLNYTTVKKNEEKGNYRLVLQIGWVNSYASVLFNYSHKDPVLRTIFGDKMFRIALSVERDRDEINKIVFKGVNRPSQPGPDVGPPYHGELPRFHVYTEYDPQLANHLLDVMGLKWDEKHEVRLRPDGKPLHLVVSIRTDFPQEMTIAEMYKKYWKDVGIQTTLKPLSAQFLRERMLAGQYDISIQNLGFASKGFFMAAMRDEPVPLSSSWPINPPWGAWLVSEGEKGEEPPEGVKRLFEIHREFKAEPDPEKRVALEKEMFLIHSENLWTIGSVNQSPELRQVRYMYLNNRVKNVPVPCAGEWYYTIPSSWFIEE